MRQLQFENDDLRERVQYLEVVTGKDSQLYREQVSEESKIDWAQLLLTSEDSQEDIRILAASKEKIAHEIL